MLGLTPNAFYTLTFNISGDNRPNSLYTFLLDVNGANLLSVTGSWSSTTAAGHSQTVGVQADGSGSLSLKFYQASLSSSSPILDDVVVSIPDGGLTLMLLGMALGGLGYARRMVK